MKIELDLSPIEIGQLLGCLDAVALSIGDPHTTMQVVKLREKVEGAIGVGRGSRVKLECPYCDSECPYCRREEMTLG